MDRTESSQDPPSVRTDSEASTSQASPIKHTELPKTEANADEIGIKILLSQPEPGSTVSHHLPLTEEHYFTNASADSFANASAPPLEEEHDPFANASAPPEELEEEFDLEALMREAKELI
jgi:hypothetical protein